jgi:hypothetical protein
MDSIQSIITFGVVDKPSLLYITPANAAATERTSLNDFLAIHFVI